MPDLSVRSRMAARRALYAIRGFRWWAIAALVLAALTVVLALTGQDIRTVLAVGVAALVIAVLSTTEET